MFDLPNHGPPSPMDWVAIIASVVLAAITAGLRTGFDGRTRSAAARLLVIAAGGAIGGLSGALCIAYSVDPIIAVVVSGLLGSCGENWFRASAKIGAAAEERSVAIAEKITGIDLKEDDQ